MSVAKKVKPKCCGRVDAGSDGWRTSYRPCTRYATSVYEGKPYCGQHNPAKRAARLDANFEKHKVERDAKYAELARQSLAVAFVGDIPADRLRELVDRGGLAALLKRLEERP